MLAALGFLLIGMKVWNHTRTKRQEYDAKTTAEASNDREQQIDQQHYRFTLRL